MGPSGDSEHTAATRAMLATLEPAIAEAMRNVAAELRLSALASQDLLSDLHAWLLTRNPDQIGRLMGASSRADYLHAVLENLQAKRWIAENRRNATINRMAERDRATHEAPEHAQPLEEFSRLELESKLRHAVSSLSQEDRLLLELRVIQQLPWERIATLLRADEEEPHLRNKFAAQLRQRFRRLMLDIRASLQDS